MNIRIVVADQSVARFYDIQRPSSALQPCGELFDPLAQQQDRDFDTDRPGRVFARASGAGPRTAGVRHAVGGENTPRVHEATLFARRITETLEKENRGEKFDRLVLMAGPAFLGLLRGEMSDGLRERVVAEVNKNLTHQDDTAVRSHLPQDVFHEIVRRH